MLFIPKMNKIDVNIYKYMHASYYQLHVHTRSYLESKKTRKKKTNLVTVQVT